MWCTDGNGKEACIGVGPFTWRQEAISTADVGCSEHTQVMLTGTPTRATASDNASCSSAPPLTSSPAGKHTTHAAMYRPQARRSVEADPQQHQAATSLISNITHQITAGDLTRATASESASTSSAPPLTSSPAGKHTTHAAMYRPQARRSVEADPQQHQAATSLISNITHQITAGDLTRATASESASTSSAPPLTSSPAGKHTTHAAM